ENPAPMRVKILSAVARVQQRFGVAHVVNVLRGSETQLVTSRGHHQLSVFGLLRGSSADEVRGYVDQLLAFELLRQAGDDYPVLQLTASGMALLKDASSAPDLALVRQRKPDAAPARRSRAEKESWEGVNRALFERLRTLRA